MKRRDFITLLGSAVTTWPLAARAQPPAKMKRIAFVNSAGEVSRISVSGLDDRNYRAFFEELSHLGYIEGQNLGVERYSGEGRTEHYPALARDVVDSHPDLILAVGGRLSLDFKMATTTIPIVTMVIDPIALGLVESIARPGGNITGVTIAGGLEIIGNAWDCWSKRSQNCPPSATLHPNRSGKMQEVWQPGRQPQERGLPWRPLYWAPLSTSQRTSASSGQ